MEDYGIPVDHVGGIETPGNFEIRKLTVAQARVLERSWEVCMLKKATFSLHPEGPSSSPSVSSFGLPWFSHELIL